MRHTIVSWTKFCEWVQGKTVRAELDGGRSTEIRFEDGSEACVYSECDMRFGEKTLKPPMVSIQEKSP